MPPTGKPFTRNDPRRWTKGRGKGAIQLPDILRRIGKEKLPSEVQQALARGNANSILHSKTMTEAMCRRIYLEAIRGNPDAWKFIAERTEGKVKDQLMIEEGSQLVITEEIVDATENTP